MKATVMLALLVGSGGFIGALARFGLAAAVHRLLPLTSFPVGTLAVNLLGCFGIGLLSGLADARSLFGPEFRAFLFIGLLGGFTTFSTFGYETFGMIREDDYVRAAGNAGLHVILGLSVVWLGYSLMASR